MKGATTDGTFAILINQISIHAPYEGSDENFTPINRMGKISIHAPYEGSDIVDWYVFIWVMYFNPRSL